MLERSGPQRKKSPERKVPKHKPFLKNVDPAPQQNPDSTAPEIFNSKRTRRFPTGKGIDNGSIARQPWIEIDGKIKFMSREYPDAVTSKIQTPQGMERISPARELRAYNGSTQWGEVNLKRAQKAGISPGSIVVRNGYTNVLPNGRISGLGFQKMADKHFEHELEKFKIYDNAAEWVSDVARNYTHIVREIDISNSSVRYKFIKMDIIKNEAKNGKEVPVLHTLVADQRDIEDPANSKRGTIYDSVTCFTQMGKKAKLKNTSTIHNEVLWAKNNQPINIRGSLPF